MTSDSDDRTRSEQEQDPAPAPREPEPRAPGQHEDFGPLELMRTRKADGRALLLFTHRREQADP
jgi:hypothetical protein